MSTERVKRSMRDAERRLERAARAVRRAGAITRARVGSADRSELNVVRRENVVIAANVGRDGSSVGVSAHQHAPIRQDGRTTDADEETYVGE